MENGMRWLGAAVVAAIAMMGARWMPESPSRVPASAPARAAAAVSRHATERGELGALKGNLLSLRTDGGTKVFQVTDNTVWREGAHVVGPGVVRASRGNSAKVRYRTDDDTRIAENVVVSPESVTPGVLTAFDVTNHAVSLTTKSGVKRYSLDPQTSCRVGQHVVAADALPAFVGRRATITTSIQTGRVIAVHVAE